MFLMQIFAIPGLHLLQCHPTLGKLFRPMQWFRSLQRMSGQHNSNPTAQPHETRDDSEELPLSPKVGEAPDQSLKLDNDDDDVEIDFDKPDNKAESDSDDKNTAEETRGQVVTVQVEVATTLKVCIMAVSFGNIMPLLALLLPLLVFLKMAAHRWTEQLQNGCNGCHSSIGRMVAQQVLVAHPKLTFETMSILLPFFTSTCLMIDLQFSIGPIILHLILFLFGASIYIYRIQSLWNMAEERCCEPDNNKRGCEPDNNEQQQAQDNCCNGPCNSPIMDEIDFGQPAIELNPIKGALPSGDPTRFIRNSKFEDTGTMKKSTALAYSPRASRRQMRFKNDSEKQTKLEGDSPRRRSRTLAERPSSPTGAHAETGLAARGASLNRREAPNVRLSGKEKQRYLRAVKKYKDQLAHGLISKEQFKALRHQEAIQFRRQLNESKLQAWRVQEQNGLISAAKFERLKASLDVERVSSDDELNDDVATQVGEAGYGDYGHNSPAASKLATINI